MVGTQFFVLFIWGDVEPHLHGPYKSAKTQLRVARKLRRENGPDDGGIYPAMLKRGKLSVGAYCGGDLDDED